MEKVPEIIITTEDNPEQREIMFSDLYKLREHVTSIMLLWDYNSYYVNITNSYFIINGGRRIQPTVATKMVHKHLEYARRNRMDIQMAGDDELENNEIQVTYLIGIKGIVDSEEKSILLHIAANGSYWTWNDKR